jgi:hypothetical protein
MRRTYAVAVVISIMMLSVFSVGFANAITGNYQNDTARTCVGLVVFYDYDLNGNRVPVAVCSGVLISPTELLTAAHACTVQSVMVCFDSGPITWKVVNGQIQLEGITATYDGTVSPHPDFEMNLDGKNGAPDFMTNDVAVVHLKEAVPQNVVSEYGELPSEGLVDTLPANTQVQLFGYGMQNHDTPRNTGVKDTWTGAIMRCSAEAKIISGNFAWSDDFIRCSANPGQGNGGIAYGDSGGPVFLGQSNIILALNSYVNNPNCVGNTYHNRIDTPQVLNWIIQEVTVDG